MELPILKENKEYVCKRKYNNEVICVIKVINLSWLDTKSDKTKYVYDQNFLDMGKYIFRDLEHRSDIFEIKFSPDIIRPNMVYIAWLCKDFYIIEQ